MYINSVRDLIEVLRRGPYAWPGGYPLYFLTSDGETLSFAAARAEVWTVARAVRDRTTGNYPDRSWDVVAVEVNWEDTDLYCAHTNIKIESAYGDDTV